MPAAIGFAAIEGVAAIGGIEGAVATAFGATTVIGGINVATIVGGSLLFGSTIAVQILAAPESDPDVRA